MTEQTHGSLRELQELDRRIEEAEDGVRSFDPQLAEVEEPALHLEQEVSTTRARLQEMRLDERRVELSADDKRARSKKLQERLNTVRNLREESAVRTELDILRSAMEGEEQEALTLMDQIRKLEVRLEEQTAALERARAEVEPHRDELLGAREEAKRELSRLREQREAHARAIAPQQLRTYEGIRGGGRRKAVSELTPDGACGNCFSVVPLQLQNEIRRGGAMVRCEGCGVILTARLEE